MCMAKLKGFYLTHYIWNVAVHILAQSNQTGNCLLSCQQLLYSLSRLLLFSLSTNLAEKASRPNSSPGEVVFTHPHHHPHTQFKCYCLAREQFPLHYLNGSRLSHIIAKWVKLNSQDVIMCLIMFVHIMITLSSKLIRVFWHIIPLNVFEDIYA